MTTPNRNNTLDVSYSPTQGDILTDDKGTRWIVEKGNTNTKELYATQEDILENTRPGTEYTSPNIYQLLTQNKLTLTSQRKITIETPPNPKLTIAHGLYNSKDYKGGDQFAAEWLLNHRQIITDRHERLYAYSEEQGHYRKEGETLLKADIAKEFSEIATKARISEIIAKCKALSYRDQQELEKTTPPNLIPLQNGIYNLITKTLIPHNPIYFFTFKHPVSYNPKATCPNITQFLNSIVETKDKEILLDIAALCLYRARVTRNFYILVGEGHNGKGAYIRVIRNLLGGERVVSITPQALSDDVFAPAQLNEKNANIGGDIGNGLINDTSLIKSITGGDAVSVQRKGVDREEKELYCEFIWSSNTPPRIPEDTLAIWDRLVSIVFPYTFVEDPKEENEKQADNSIENKMSTEEELSGFLNLCLERLPTLVENKRLTIKINPEEARRKYRIVSDTVAVFVEENCTPSQFVPPTSVYAAEGFVRCDDLFEAYRVWCKGNSSPMVSLQKFGRVMRALGYEVMKLTVDGNRHKCYVGLELNSPEGSNGTDIPLLPAGKTKVKESIGNFGAIDNIGVTGLSVADLRRFFDEKRDEKIDRNALVSAGFSDEVIEKGTLMLQASGDIYRCQPNTWRVLK